MKKKLVTAITVFSAAGLLLMPFSTKAADVRFGKGYIVISNETSDTCFSWQELLDRWCTSEAPDTEAPETEEQETETDKTDTEIQEPETDNSGTELPDIPETNVPNEPETDKPENGASKPSEPETETQKPGADTDEKKSYAEQVVDLVNEERAKEGLSPLVLDETAASAAYVRAKETEISFSHTRPDGRSFSTALTDQGMKFNGAGENIAWGQKSPEAVMEAWMNSPGHRANILNAKFTSIGVGYYQNSAGTNYWTQLFTY